MIDPERMWCAGCGQEFPRREGGGCYKECTCKGKGYWSPRAPLARDAWALEARVWRKEINAYLYLYRFPK